MDYRKRRYYLARFTYHNEELKKLKEIVTSLKIHPPYNHFIKNTSKDKYDGFYTGNIGEDSYWQTLLSCKTEEREKIIEYFNIYRTPCLDYFEVSQLDCGQ